MNRYEVLGVVRVGVPERTHVVAFEYVNRRPGGRVGLTNPPFGFVIVTEDVNVYVTGSP
jgi:hypothetical protein